MRRAAIAGASLLAIAAAVALVASAAAAPVKQYTPKPGHACKVHYVKRRESVKEHKHGKVVKVKETVCVYVAPKPTVTTPTGPAPPAVPVPTTTASTTSLEAPVVG